MANLKRGRGLYVFIWIALRARPERIPLPSTGELMDAKNGELPSYLWQKSGAQDLASPHATTLHWRFIIFPATLFMLCR